MRDQVRRVDAEGPRELELRSSAPGFGEVVEHGEVGRAAGPSPEGLREACAGDVREAHEQQAAGRLLVDGGIGGGGGGSCSWHG